MAAEASGFIELDRAVRSITVGRRHRRDLGDLDGLAASIRELGLLQPITVTQDGVLVCGARRLAAVKLLGWQHVSVWVRSQISVPLEHLLAELHENTVREPLTPTEAAALYQELRVLLAEDAARRQRATRFGAEPGTKPPGGANLAPPSAGKSRSQAAELVTGSKSYTTLERVCELQRTAEDSALPDDLRQMVADALTAIDRDGKVMGRYQQVKTAVEQHAAAVTGEDGDALGGPAEPNDRSDHSPEPTRNRRYRQKRPDNASDPRPDPRLVVRLPPPPSRSLTPPTPPAAPDNGPAETGRSWRLTALASLTHLPGKRRKH